MLNMLGISAGVAVAVAAYGEARFDAFGVMLQLAAVAAEATWLVLIQILVTSKGKSLNPHHLALLYRAVLPRVLDAAMVLRRAADAAAAPLRSTPPPARSPPLCSTGRALARCRSTPLHRLPRAHPPPRVVFIDLLLLTVSAQAKAAPPWLAANDVVTAVTAAGRRLPTPSSLVGLLSTLTSLRKEVRERRKGEKKGKSKGCDMETLTCRAYMGPTLTQPSRVPH
jgi:hypothetical protein